MMIITAINTNGVLSRRVTTLLTSFNNENADFSFFSKRINTRKSIHESTQKESKILLVRQYTSNSGYDL